MKSFSAPLLTLTLLLFQNAQASTLTDSLIVENQVTLTTGTGDLQGTLTTPANFKTGAVGLIIAGSGPTDRDGNNPMMKNNSLKMLSESLAKNGIATLRYDKRGVGESKPAGKSESDLRFENYVDDAKEWIRLLKKDKRFSKVIIIGHSEGSLIGMIAGKEADKFISIAGAGQSADKVIKEQLVAQPQTVKDLTFPIIDSLVNGQTVENVNPMLFSLFRPSVQPYLISWFRFDPQVEIKKLSIPVLIVQGTNDIQVSVADAKLLVAANPNAILVLIENLNHILKIVIGDRQQNLITYNNPTLPVSKELAIRLTTFINN